MESVVDKIVGTLMTHFLNPVIYLLISLTFMYFFWGLAIFIFNADNQDKRIEGRQHMIWGVFGIFVILSVWGIINFIDSTVKVFN